MNLIEFNEVIGWIGGVAFTLCGWPLAYNVWKTHEVKALTWTFLWLWMLGECATLIYILFGNYHSGIWQYPLITNYIVNFLLGIFLIRAKYKYNT
jgi:uncharacterized protein with PQ loop repeat